MAVERLGKIQIELNVSNNKTKRFATLIHEY